MYTYGEFWGATIISYASSPTSGLPCYSVVQALRSGFVGAGGLGVGPGGYVLLAVSERHSMNHSLFAKVLSVFDPEDDELSEESLSTIQLYRLLSGLGAILIPLFGLMRGVTHPEAIDPMWMRLGLTGLILGLLAISYHSTHVRQNYDEWMRGLVYVVMTWIVVVGAANGFSGTYDVGLLLSYSVLAAIVGIGVRTIRPVLVFSGYAVLLTIGGVALGGASGSSPVVLVAGIATVGLFETLVIRGWLGMQTELRRSRDRHSTAQRVAGLGSWEYDIEEREVNWSAEARRLFGWDPDENVSYEKYMRAVHPEDRGMLQRQHKEALKGGQPIDCEYRIRRGDGETRVLHEQGQAEIDEEDTARYISGTLLDITARKERERTLRERTRQLEKVRESVTEVVWMSSADKEEMQFISDAYEEIWGRPTEEIKERPASYLEGIHSEDRERVRSAVAVQKERPEAYDETYRVVQPTGEIRWVQDRTAGVYDDEGALERIVGVATDITERRRMEGRLIERRRKVEAIYTATDCLLTVEDPVEVLSHVLGVLRDVFDYPMCGVAFLDDGMVHPHEVRTGDGYKMPLPEPYSIEQDTAVTRAYSAGEPVEIEDVEALDNDLDYGDVVALAGVPIDERGVVVIGQAEHRGIDPFDLQLIEMLAAQAATILERIDGEKELRAARREAERSDRLKSIFLANMSHEIRTPLTSVIGFAEAIGDEMGDEETGPVPQFANLIERSGRRLLETLNGVLTLSKLEAGSMELSPEPIDLTEEAQEMVELFTPQAEHSGLLLTVEKHRSPLWVWADTEGVRLVLRNLVSNAIKYTEAGGEVTVRVRQEDEEIVVEVEDTGIGMDPDDVPALFKPFRQESEGLGREYQGTGLGLAVTKQAIEKMDGSIEVVTEKDKGTRISVWLPRLDPRRSPEAPTHAAECTS